MDLSLVNRSIDGLLRKDLGIAMTLGCKNGMRLLCGCVLFVRGNQRELACVSEIVLPSFGAARARLKESGSQSNPHDNKNFNLTFVFYF